MATTISPGGDENKIWHIFGKPDHNLGGLVQEFGSAAEAYKALVQATEETVISKGLSGVFETSVQVGSHTVTVRGAVVNNVIKIGTAFK
ncbi:MAG TPA: hypothetical protein VFL79_09535 [Terriglobia bacterium]|nr:hypothetical protein [Terriglobia bacterium]